MPYLEYQGISIVRVTVCVCVCEHKSMPMSTDCLQHYTDSLAHLASRTVVSVTGRNTQHSLRRGKKWRKAKRQRTLRNNHSLPRHPHTEFCQCKNSHPLALSEVLQTVQSQTDTVQQVFGRNICLVNTVRSRQWQSSLYRPNRSHNVWQQSKQQRLSNV